MSHKFLSILRRLGEGGGCLILHKIYLNIIKNIGRYCTPEKIIIKSELLIIQM